MPNPREKPWKKSWVALRSASSYPEPVARALGTFSPNCHSYLYINIVICVMRVAPQKPMAVGRTTAFVAPTGLFPSRFRFGFYLPEASLLFSRSCELFAHFCGPRPLFSSLSGLFCPKTPGGGGGLAQRHLKISRCGGFSRVTFPHPVRQEAHNAAPAQ